MTTDKFRFFHPIQVRFADTDAQGHVFFGTYFTYFDEAMAAYMRAIGCPWQSLADLGIDMYYVDANCQFKAPSYFEETLHVYARISRIGNSSVTFEFAIHKQADDQAVATGQLVSVVVDLESSQSTIVPEKIRSAVSAYENEA
ncbi:MAG: thioesterase family protein [Chloroflexota bacterium]